FHGAIRASERLGTELKIDEIYETVNQALCTINKDRIGSDKFMTQNYLKETNGQVAHSGTHEIALLYKKNADTVIELKEMTNRTGFLGLSPLITAKMSVGSFDVQEGDILVLYSDGVIEAKDKYGHQYGLDRVKTIMKQHAGMRSQTIIDRIIESLEEFAKEGDLVKHKGKFTDDITLVVMKKEQ
ncbi:MAG: PP2C family protein-serine/threonine phosphatase, partial [Spirochaetia bacterium]